MSFMLRDNGEFQIKRNLVVLSITILFKQIKHCYTSASANWLLLYLSLKNTELHDLKF